MANQFESWVFYSTPSRLSYPDVSDAREAAGIPSGVNEILLMSWSEALEGEVSCDDECDCAHPHRHRPAIEKHVPFQEKPAKVRDGDEKENQSGEERERLLTHVMPPLDAAVDRMLPRQAELPANCNSAV